MGYFGLLFCNTFLGSWPQTVLGVNVVVVVSYPIHSNDGILPANDGGAAITVGGRRGRSFSSASAVQTWPSVTKADAAVLVIDAQIDRTYLHNLSFSQCF